MIIRETRSVCPFCLKNIPARLDKEPDGRVYLEKSCPEHGSFRVLVWQGELSLEQWAANSQPLCGRGLHCPENCGICPEHEIGSCCVLLEVTKRCNLRCRYCFADGGQETRDPELQELKDSVEDIVRLCGHPLLQLSGGEPSLRDDLPELIRFAKARGCSYVQLNTNGIRLAEDRAYVKELAEAGLDIVFLQFDGTEEQVYRFLRGRPLLETKLKAIENCSEALLGVTLVPTVVKGVNDSQLGDIISLAKTLVPAVRGIHFQPLSYFGRYPGEPDNSCRYTLDALMADISRQAGIPIQSFMPSRCDHPLCGFHSDFLLEPDGSLRPLSAFSRSSPVRGGADDNREYVARHWRRPPPEPAPEMSEEMDFDTFLYRVRQQSLCLSAMAFQDAYNLNIERLHRCSLHVYSEGRVKPFCANYLSAAGHQPPED